MAGNSRFVDSISFISSLRSMEKDEKYIMLRITFVINDNSFYGVNETVKPNNRNRRLVVLSHVQSSTIETFAR